MICLSDAREFLNNKLHQGSCMPSRYLSGYILFSTFRGKIVQYFKGASGVKNFSVIPAIN